MSNETARYNEIQVSNENKKFKKNKLSKKYRLLKNKILFKTVILFITALIFTVLLYKYVLYGKLADRIISLIQYIFKTNYRDALSIYYYHIRNYFEIFIVGAAMCIYL